MQELCQSIFNQNIEKTIKLNPLLRHISSFAYNRILEFYKRSNIFLMPFGGEIFILWRLEMKINYLKMSTIKFR